jgi:hypothetical protein
MINGIGVVKSPVNLYEEDEGLCNPIHLDRWYIYTSVTIACSLVLSICRYHSFKQYRMEHLGLYLSDLIIVNSMLTAVFIKANLMYFSDENRCQFVEDGVIKMSYQIFCIALIIGYLQFIWCILLSCYLPLAAFVIMKLVQHRVRQRENNHNGQLQQIDPNSLIGGLI